MAEFATKGVAGTGLGLGIAGTALGLLNGGLGNVVGGVLGTQPVSSEDHTVNRYEAAQSAKIAELGTEIKLRDANALTLGEMNAMRNYVDGQFREIRDSLCGQSVINQKTADSFERVHDDLMCVKGNLEQQIKAERDARCCGDNAIVTYANATFYPKMVADVTVGTETTAQMLYNPVTNCGCGCGCGNG